MRYASAAALRAALDRRLVQQANETGVDIGRLRRRVVFERLLVRFAFAPEGRWVLKGGVAVEVRLIDRARTTKDLDLALCEVEADGLQVRDLLAEVLLSNPQRDFFDFRIDRFRLMSIEGAPSPVWRASLDSHLDGRTFDRVVADIVVVVTTGLRIRRYTPDHPAGCGPSREPAEPACCEGLRDRSAAWSEPCLLVAEGFRDPQAGRAKGGDHGERPGAGAKGATLARQVV